MHHAVQVIGVLLIVVGVISGLISGLWFMNGYSVGAGGLLQLGLGAIVSGVILWGLGAIVEHLVAIRRALEKQPE